MAFDAGMVEPFLVHEPPGIVGSFGDEAIEFAEDCGILLDPWQAWWVRMSLSERAGGGFASFENAAIVPRQNGKNYAIRAVQIALLFLRDDVELVLHTAHMWDTVNVHRKWLMGLLETDDEFAALLKPVDRRTGRSKSFVNINGDEQIVLTTGQSIVFKTRSGGKGRGFTGDAVFLDEAQKLSAGSMGDSIPTLSTRKNAQIFYTASAPNEGSAVLHAVRARAERGDPEDRLFYAEWGNDESVLELDSDDPKFIEAIVRANPAVGAGRITMDYIRQEIRTFSGDIELVEEHRRERLGVPTLPPTPDENSLLPEATWGPLGCDPDDDGGFPEITSAVRVGFDVSEDRRFASFGVAGRCDDGRVQLELADRRWVNPAAAEPSISELVDDWVVPRAKELAARYSTPIRVEKSSPAGAWIRRMQAAGVDVEELSTMDHAHALGMLVDEAEAGRLRHLNSPFLNEAVRVAQTRPNGDALVWSRRTSNGDISPLIACTTALGAVPTAAEKKLEPFVVFA